MRVGPSILAHTLNMYIFTIHMHTHYLHTRTWQRLIADAIRAEEGKALAPVFSRNRGFKRRFKRHGTGRAVLDGDEDS
jgi:hypothetical protein